MQHFVLPLKHEADKYLWLMTWAGKRLPLTKF